MTVYSTCGSCSDPSICGTIHCVGQHLLQKQRVVGDNGGCEVRLHPFCHLEHIVYFTVIILCDDLQAQH